MSVVYNQGTNYTLYYNALDYFKTIMTNHPSIAKVTTGDMMEVDTKEFPMYPIGNINIFNTNISDSTTKFEIQLVVADKIKNKNNESNPTNNEQTIPFYGTDDTIDILANTLAIINDLTSYTEYAVAAFDIDSDILCEPFVDRFNNGLAGHVATFTLTTHNDRNRCLFFLINPSGSGYQIRNCSTSETYYAVLNTQIATGSIFSSYYPYAGTCYQVLQEVEDYNDWNLVGLPVNNVYGSCVDCANAQTTTTTTLAPTTTTTLAPTTTTTAGPTTTTTSTTSTTTTLAPTTTTTAGPTTTTTTSGIVNAYRAVGCCDSASYYVGFTATFGALNYVIYNPVEDACMTLVESVPPQSVSFTITNENYLTYTYGTGDDQCNRCIILGAHECPGSICYNWSLQNTNPTIPRSFDIVNCTGSAQVISVPASSSVNVCSYATPIARTPAQAIITNLGACGGTTTTTTTLAPTTTTTTLEPTTTTTTTSTTTTTLAPTTTTTTESSVLDIQYLIVAGGGGGSNDNLEGNAAAAAGGGAGGYISGSTILSGSNSLSVVVGTGGTAGTFGFSNNQSGTNSEFLGLSAIGGGYGGRQSGGSGNGANGGSGGGGYGSTGAGGSGTAGQGFEGNSGGALVGANLYRGGNGGGASSAPYDIGDLGARIPGLSKLWLDGVYYSSGGKGAGLNNDPTNPGSAGNGGTGVSMGVGTAGQGGIVKIRYAGTPRATGGDISQSGGYTYHTFSTNGTFIWNGTTTTTTTAAPSGICYNNTTVFFTSDDNTNFYFGYTECNGSQGTISGGTVTPGQFTFNSSYCLRDYGIVAIPSAVNTIVTGVSQSNQCGTYTTTTTTLAP